MKEVKEIKKEKEVKLANKLIESGLPLTSDEINWIARQASNIFEEALIAMVTRIPRTGENLTRLVCHGNSSIDGKHPINGKWLRITQIFTDKGVEYYTQGKREVVNVK